MKRGLDRRLVLVFGILAVNGSYLYFCDSASFIYVTNLLAHVIVGLIATVGLVMFIRPLWSSLPSEGRFSLLLLAIGAVTGVILTVTGTTQPYKPLLLIHIFFATAGVLALLLHLLIRRLWWQVLAGAILAAIVFPVWNRLEGPNPKDVIENPLLVASSMEEEGGGPDSPFYPSAADTSTSAVIPSEVFLESESCGRAGCHPDIYEQWKSSAHHLASFSNQWYRKSVEYMQEVVGPEPSKWCGGCHDHALLFSGKMDTPVKQLLDLPEAHAGITCTSCHLITEVKGSMGNGSFVLEYPPLHDLATSQNPLVQFLHDYIVELDPEPHKRTFMKPFMREQTGEYCSSCHKVHLDKPVNNYRWIRGFNEYDGWQSSGVSGQGARSFYYPESPMDCADCHMPLISSRDAGNVAGVVHDHRFPGANTALAVAHGNEEQLELVTSFLKNDQVSIDIFALSTAAEDEEAYVPPQESHEVASTFAEGDGLGFAVRGRGSGYTAAADIVAPVDRVEPKVRRGDTVRVDVVVRTLNVGHFFPGGTVDAYDVWVELKAIDNEGRLLFWSGYVPEDKEGRKGPVDPGAHFYRSVMLDARGNLINKRNAWAARSVAYVRLIPPGAADTIHFRLHIPEEVGSTIHLEAKLNYRKFSWWNTQFAYAGVRAPDGPNPEVTPHYDDGDWVFTGDTSNVSGEVKEIPEIPIVVMAEDRAVLQVSSGDEERATESVYSGKDLIRWNDYGIGLLLQGDLKAAEKVFITVTEIDPGYVDGWVNTARSRLLEGRTDEAQEALTKALELDPDLAKTHYFLGVAYKNQGNYEKALEHFRKTSERYPKDRVTLNQIGRIYFLQRKFEEAIGTLNRVISVDPEDLQAHYNLMLCYRALGNTEAALHEQKLYLRFKADESSQSIAGPYLREHPEDNNERQAIHEHTSFPLESIPSSIE